ncbi:hypothetical protein [Massilia timonae]|jgi:hypothetical protein|uniref:hypothetical protein n=1 Tax=Massilia timonae TaxID=47229 RepID=UPI002357DBD2|nr:hypothetical protein [Massilia timonae]
MGIAAAAIEGVWGAIGQIDPATKFWTPAEQAWFRVTEADLNEVTITTSNDSSIKIRKQAFVSTIAYLLSNGHTQASSPCEIRSNKMYDEAGPLCRAARIENGTMTITYVLPVLKAMGLVDIEPSRPSATWLLA